MGGFEPGIFARMNAFVEDGFLKNLLESTIAQEKVQVLINCLSVAIAIYIMYKGYLMLAGKTQEPMRDLLWDCVAKVIIIGILKNADGLYSLTIDFINALAGWADGSGRAPNAASALLPVKMDNILRYMVGYVDIPLFKETNIALWPFLLVLSWVSILFATCFTFFVYITTKITLTLLIFFSPIFIYCKLFGFLKNAFTQWVQLIFANILTLFMISLVFQYGEALISKIIINYNDLYLAKASPSSIQFVAYLFCACLMQVIIIKICVKIAEQTASVSLEAAGMGAVAGVAGSAAGLAMGAGALGFKAARATGVAGGIGGLAGTLGKFADNKITKGKIQAAGSFVSDKFSKWKGQISNFINTPRGGKPPPPKGE